MWPAAQATALTCANITNKDDDACKLALGCFDTIVNQGGLYVSKLQNDEKNAIRKSLKALLTKTPKYFCIGGSENGKACTNNTNCPDGQCQPNFKTNDFAKTGTTSKATLQKLILKKCCPNGADPCDVASDEVGIDDLTVCDDAASNAAAGNDVAAYKALAKCFSQGLVGVRRPLEGATEDNLDFSDGESGVPMADASTSHFQKMLGGSSLTRPRGNVGLAGNENPRMIDQISGSNLVQIGTSASASSPGTGQGVTYLALARCTNAGPAFDLGCVSDPDCDTAKNAGDGACPDASCPGDVCQFEGPKTDLNILTLTDSCANNLGTCLVSNTRDSGNGTPASGSINLATGALDQSAPISTEVWVTGTGQDCALQVPCPVCEGGTCTGVCSNNPLTTCTADSDCGGGNFCTSDGADCNAAPGTPTQQCLPVYDVLASNTAPTAEIPNPFNLSTGTSELEAVTSAGTGGGLAFCGFCDADTSADPSTCDYDTFTNPTDGVCAQGCGGTVPQGTAECAQRLNLGANDGYCVDDGSIQCDTANGTLSNPACPSSGPCAAVTCKFGKSLAGFKGESGITTVSATGYANPYAPVAVGVFCTGTTGSPVVDGSAGVPGPVRVINPYVNAYRAPKDTDVE
jgi:hypothetical protein